MRAARNDRPARERTDPRLIASLVSCCAGPMALIIVLTSMLGLAVGPAVAIVLALVVAGLCFALAVQQRRGPRLRR